jgi:hypothetical protein
VTHFWVMSFSVAVVSKQWSAILWLEHSTLIKTDLLHCFRIETSE